MDQNRADKERHRLQVQAANRARYKAVKKLVAENQDRYDALYASYAAEEGVVPNPRGRVDVAKLQREMAQMQARLARLTGTDQEQAS